MDHEKLMFWTFYVLAIVGIVVALTSLVLGFLIDSPVLLPLTFLVGFVLAVIGFVSLSDW